jgi:NADH dehydrogenase (ubiquinone) 1 alpha/beta subcomplex 1
MEPEEIRSRVKRVISGITNIPATEIPDGASYREDLALDSLSALEVIIGVEFEFKFTVPDLEVPDVHTVQDTVQLVERHLAAAQA